MCHTHTERAKHFIYSPYSSLIPRTPLASGLFLDRKYDADQF